VAFLQSKMLLRPMTFSMRREFCACRSQQTYCFGGGICADDCEDAWNDKHFWRKQLYSVDPVEKLISAGGNLMLNISASPFWIGKRELRHDMLAAIACKYRYLWPWSISWGNDSWCLTVRALPWARMASHRAGVLVRRGLGFFRFGNAGWRSSRLLGRRGSGRE